MNKIWCPICNQGWVVQVRIQKLDLHAFVCKECDNTWFKIPDGGNEHPVDFRTFMKSKGLKGLWTEVVEVN